MRLLKESDLTIEKLPFAIKALNNVVTKPNGNKLTLKLIGFHEEDIQALSAFTNTVPEYKSNGLADLFENYALYLDQGANYEDGLAYHQKALARREPLHD